MDWGVTPTGFNAKSEADILESAQAVQLAGIDPNLDLQPTNPLGVLNGIFAAELALGWQALLVIYNGEDPDQSSDDQLTSNALLIGVERIGEEPTLVVGCVVNVNAGFDALPFTLFASVTGVSPAQLYTNKERVQNLGVSPDNITVDFVAVDAGPQQCLAGALTTIAVPSTGWNSITNPNDGIVGQFVETDPDLRTRRSAELAAAGTTTAAAVRSAILEASQNGKFSAPVVNCTVLFNDDDLPDANGLPGHSIEAIVYQPGATGADDQLVADIIAETKAGGIKTWGTAAPLNHTDTQGVIEIIRFTRPSTRRIYVAITVFKDATKFPPDGSVQIQEAIANYGNSLSNQKIYAKHVQAQAFNVAGVLDVTAFTIDTVFPPVATANITIGVREVSTWSTGDITVTVT